MANLLIVTENANEMSHWLGALNGHYHLQVVNTTESVLTHKLNSGAIDLIIVDADFLKDDYSQLSLMASYANKTMIIGNNCSEEMQVQVVVDGACGYSEKSINADLALRAVKGVLKNEIWLDRNQISMVIRSLNEKNSVKRTQHVNIFPKPLLSCLTSRELDVAELIYQGDANLSIALKLDISERTVKAHLSSIFRKLNVQDRFRLVIYLKDLNRSEEA